MRFFISRHVTESSPAHVRALAGRALDSIRVLYPSARVTIVEDKVPRSLSLEVHDPLVRVVENPFPGSGEMGTVFLAAQTDPDYNGPLAIMHDSMVLLGTLPGDTGPIGVRALWDFKRYQFHHLPEVLRILASLVATPDVYMKYDHILQMACHERYSKVLEMIALYTRPITNNHQWSGCFGMGLLATRAGLQRINATFGILEESLIREIDTREKRQAMERIVGLAMILSAGEHLRPPVCGEIFDHPDPWKTESAAMSVADIKEFARSRGYSAPIAKSWVGR